MRIINETHEPLLIRYGEEGAILEPGEGKEIPDGLPELIIEPSPEPHFVSQMEISEN